MAMTSQPSANQLTLTAAATTAALRQLLAQVAQMHRAGRIHGRITPDNVFWESSQARLPEGHSTCELGGEKRSLSPPELQEIVPLSLPTNLATARERLAGLGVAIDPRRI